MSDIGVTEMTRILNEYRVKAGKKPVTRTWVGMLCKERETRKREGLPFIDAYLDASGAYRIDRDVFMLRVKNLANMSGKTGRPKKRQSSSPALTPQSQPHLASMRMLMKPPVDIKAAAGSVANHLAGWTICTRCGGEGCDDCVKGWMPKFNPFYADGRPVFAGDVIDVYVDELPSAVYGVVGGWSPEGTDLILALYDRKMRALSITYTMPVASAVLRERPATLQRDRKTR